MDILRLDKLFRYIGIHSSNFHISKSVIDNNRTAALLRALANRINKEDSPEDVEYANKFISVIESDINKLLKASGY